MQTQTDFLCEYNTGSNTGVLVINALLQHACGAWWYCSCVIYVAGAFPHAVRSNQ